MLHILKQPYPNEISQGKRAALTAGISLFVFLFLFSFAPFGLHEIPFGQRLYITLGYGLACAAAMAANYYLLMPRYPAFFNESTWTVGRQILWTAWILFSISIFNSFYTAWVDLFSLSFHQFFTSILQVTLVGVFPVAAIVMLDYLRLFRKHADKAKEINNKLTSREYLEDHSVILKGDSQHDRLQLKYRDLLYLTAADNYVEVVYRLRSQLNKKLLRGSLKNFEEQLKNPMVTRCHRSYIVNLSNVVSISGNAQGYQLELRSETPSIPVSRSYAERVLSRLDRDNEQVLSG